MKKVTVMISGILIALMLMSCGGEKTEEAAYLPEYTQLLDTTPGFHVYEQMPGYSLPVNIYFDNTGSMQAFLFDSNKQTNPDPMYVRFMRALRDTGHLYNTQYYCLGEDSDGEEGGEWVACGDGIYERFSDPRFYYNWYNAKRGPLSMLYFDKELDTSCINVVLTDMAEQNVNNTLLAQEIQTMCDEDGCEAYLFAFHFAYNGKAQVANPDKLSEIISKNVNGPMPYYMIITGPGEYINQYINNLKQLLEGEGLEEGEQYYAATNHLELNTTILDVSGVDFINSADYEQICQEMENGELSGLSRNMVSLKNPENLFEETKDRDIAAFSYQKTEGLKRNDKSWWLNFYVPLDNSGGDNITYDWKAQLYYVKADTEETEAAGEEAAKETEEPIYATEYQWERCTYTDVQLLMEEVDYYSASNGMDGPAYYFRIVRENEAVSVEKKMLLILTVWKEEAVPYEVPEWLDLFDTGRSDEYFQKTYNLQGFYDILFGAKNKRTEDNKIVYRTKYSEIPILMTEIQ